MKPDDTQHEADDAVRARASQIANQDSMNEAKRDLGDNFPILDTLDESAEVLDPDDALGFRRLYHMDSTKAGELSAEEQTLLADVGDYDGETYVSLILAPDPDDEEGLTQTPILLVMSDDIEDAYREYWGFLLGLRDSGYGSDGMDARMISDGGFPERESDLQINSDHYPDVMLDRDQWVGWTYPDWKDEKIKTPKMPWAPDGVEWKWGREENYRDFDTVQDWTEKVPGLGTGFIITEDDPIIFIDFDDAIIDGEIDPDVADLIQRGDTYTDISTSGTGFHMIGYGELPEGVNAIKEPINDTADIEIYDSGRFCVATGRHVVGTPEQAKHVDGFIEEMVEEYGPSESERRKKAARANRDPSDWEPDRDRDELSDIEETTDIEDQFDAIKQTRMRDIRLRSTVTNERHDGIKDMDPSWAQSDSGTRLGYDNGGWIYRQGDIGLDALQVVALEEGIIRRETEYPSGQDYFDAVEALRERGAHIPKLVDDPDVDTSVEPLPLERIEAMDHHERVRYAEKRGVEWPSVSKVRRKLENEIKDIIHNEEKAVVTSPTGSGKTYTASTKPWIDFPEMTGEQPVIHATPTKEARNQAAEYAEEAGIEYKVLKGRSELCPLARGDHDDKITIEGYKPSEYFPMRCDGQSLGFSLVHRWAEEELGETPCGGDGQCPAVTQFEDIPRTEGGNPSYDVILCTHQFLMVPGLRMATNIVIDEKPSFQNNLTGEEARAAVNEYLKFNPLPFDNAKELEIAGRDGIYRTGQTSMTDDGLQEQYRSIDRNEFLDKTIEAADADHLLTAVDRQTLANYVRGKGEVPDADDLTWGEVADMVEEAETWHIRQAVNAEDLIKEMLDIQPPTDWFRHSFDRHSLAPAIARAIFTAEETYDGRYSSRVRYEPPRLDGHANDDAGWNVVYVDVVFDRDRNINTIHTAPSFSTTRSVVGLDAHADLTHEHWKADLGDQIEYRETLTEQERTLYRRYERGLFVVQLGDSTQPITSANYLQGGQGRRIESIVNTLADRYDGWDSAITSMGAKPFLRGAMEDAGIADPELIHYGAEESRNDFSGKSRGFVAGAHDVGDEPVMNMAARLNLDVEPETDECGHCAGSGTQGERTCDKCGGTGIVRKIGRGFQGPDADRAEDIFRGYREGTVAQSIGRWARNADSDDDNAVVYVMTDAIPDGMVDAQTEGVTYLPNADQKERFEWFLDQGDGVTLKEYAEATGVSKATACRDVQKFRERGIVECVNANGPHGAHVWAPDGGSSALAEVDLEHLPPTVSDDVMEQYTWSVTIRSDVGHAIGSDEGEDSSGVEQTTINGWSTGLRIHGD